MATPPPDPTQPAEDEQFRILVIVSRPLDQSELPEIADQWALYSGHSAVNTSARLDFLRPPTIEQLRAEILSGYDVIHFDGHGAFGLRCPNCAGLNSPESRKCGRCDASLESQQARGYLAFEREDGTGDALAAEDLAGMINAAPGKPTKLVILSACESAKGGDASLLGVLKRAGIPAVLGMKESVPVELTVTLSRPFYAYLGAGLEIAEAFDQALSSLKNLPKSKEGTPAQDIPSLEGQGTSARIVDHPMRGEVVVERERIFGVPEYEFVGEFIRYDPPKGRKGLLVRTMRALLADEKLVVLTGQGGIGKSVLGAEAARRIAWRYPGGVFWRSAAEIENLGLNELLNAFDNVFGSEFRTSPVDAKRDKVLDYLRDPKTPSLIIVDNAEKIKDPALLRFLEGIPKPSSAIVTSREALEREGTSIDIDQMEASEATRLFVVEARRRKLRWGTKLTETDLAALKEISDLIEGHPLAIKLAAAMVGSDSLAVIRDRLRAAPPREVSSRFDFSYNALTESEQELLHRLAAFASSAREWAINTISTLQLFEGDETPTLQKWRDDLSELARKSFVDTFDLAIFDESGSEISWHSCRLHPLMRQYASGKAGEEAIHIHKQRAANLFLAYAIKFGENHNSLEAEHWNILAGIDWAVESQKQGNLEQKKNAAQMLIQFVSVVGQVPNGYLYVRGYWNELKQILIHATDAAKILDNHETENVLRRDLAIVAQDQGDYMQAYNLTKQCLEVFAELDDRYNIAYSLHELGNIALNMGDFVEAQRCYQESLNISSAGGYKKIEAFTEYQLGRLALARGDADEALQRYKDSLNISQDLEDVMFVADTLRELGNLALKSGYLKEAREFYGQSIKISQKLKNKDGEAITLYNLGNTYMMAYNLKQAVYYYEKCLKIFQDLNDKRRMATTLHTLGILAHENGNLVDAHRYLKDSLEINKELEENNVIATILIQLSLLNEEGKNYDNALELIREAEKLLLRLESPIADKARKIRERLEKSS